MDRLQEFNWACLTLMSFKTGRQAIRMKEIPPPCSRRTGSGLLLRQTGCQSVCECSFAYHNVYVYVWCGGVNNLFVGSSCLVIYFVGHTLTRTAEHQLLTYSVLSSKSLRRAAIQGKALLWENMKIYRKNTIRDEGSSAL